MRGDPQKAHSFEEEVRQPRAQHEVALRSEAIVATCEILGQHQLARVQMERQRADSRLPHIQRAQRQHRQLMRRQLRHVRILVVSCEKRTNGVSRPLCACGFRVRQNIEILVQIELRPYSLQQQSNRAKEQEQNENTSRTRRRACRTNDRAAENPSRGERGSGGARRSARSTRRAHGELGDRLALGTASPSPARGGGRRRLGRSGLLFQVQEQLYQCTLQKRISNEFKQFQFRCILLYCMFIQSVRVRAAHTYTK